MAVFFHYKLDVNLPRGLVCPSTSNRPTARRVAAQLHLVWIDSTAKSEKNMIVHRVADLFPKRFIMKSPGHVPGVCGKAGGGGDPSQPRRVQATPAGGSSSDRRHSVWNQGPSRTPGGRGQARGYRRRCTERNRITYHSGSHRYKTSWYILM